MSETEKQMIKNFHKYLMDSKVQKQLAETILKYAQEFQEKNKAPDFMEKSFKVFRLNFQKKNKDKFETALKRYLYIIGKLLQKDFKSGKKTYRKCISQRIVQYYLFFFSFICNNSLLEIIPELKLARMKWAGLIQDEAFIQLKQSILKQHKMFIDKGFSEENLKKIKQTHRKRGLSSVKINEYLGIVKKQQKQQQPSKNQRLIDNQSQSESDSNSQRYQENSSGHKRIKLNQGINDKYRLGSVSTNQTGSVERELYQPYPRNVVDPRYMDDSGPYPNNNMGFGHMGQSYTQNHPHMYPQIYGSYPQPYYPTFQSHLNPYAPVKQVQQQTQFSQSFPKATNQKMKQTRAVESNTFQILNIRKKLVGQSYTCNQCGMIFQSKQLQKAHFQRHFLTSLEKANEAQLKRKMKKQSHIQLLDLKSWEQVGKKNQKQYKFEVLVSSLDATVSSLCFFCNEQLEISFSPHYENWVYEDAIKVQSHEKTKLMHYYCYDCFKSDQSNSL